MLTNKPFACEYCEAGFSKESTLFAHLCEQKRRALQKNEKRVQLGYYAFTRFYQLSANYKGTKTYEEFCKSSFYNAFVKFGSFVSNVKPLYPEKYIDYIVTSNVKIDKWCNEELYEKYANQLIKKEPMETALERSIETMTAWAEEKSSAWNHYFLYATSNRITRDLKDGKISPWLILNCVSGKKVLSEFSDEQLNLISDVIDPSHWAMKFKRQPGDVELVKEISKKANL
jgi:hypothetical protein